VQDLLDWTISFRISVGIVFETLTVSFIVFSLFSTSIKHKKRDGESPIESKFCKLCDGYLKGIQNIERFRLLDLTLRFSQEIAHKIDDL